MNNWVRVKQSNLDACALADRHYSRQKIGSNKFMPPGRQIILLSADKTAVWGSSWPYPQYVMRGFLKNAWVCTIFRNESKILSSELIKLAIVTTQSIWQDIPSDGFITFVDKTKVKSKKNFGYCFLKAGFKEVGETSKGLLIFQMPSNDIIELINNYSKRKAA